MLMALDLPLPKKVFGHGWLIVNGGKISKSLGNYKDPREYIETYGVDAVRYFALREVSFGNDGNFSEEALITRTNGDLANILGNLVNRTIGMVNKYFDGVVTNKNVSCDIDDILKEKAIKLKTIVDDDMKKLEVSKSLEHIFELFRDCNKYIDETMPWVLAKDESKLDRLNTVLYNLVESIRIGTVLLQAYLPDTADSIFKQLNTDKISYDTLDKFGYYESGTKVGEAKVLFQRIEDKK
jgi:methionyl-tRNA synthetase